MWLDFDDFLRDPAASLAALAAFFGVSLDTAGAQHLAADPLMRRYSKAAEYEYSAALREQVLAEARREQGAAISQASKWLERAAGECPAVERAIERASARLDAPGASG